MKAKNNTGFWVVIAIAAVGGIGYWYYQNKLSSTLKTFSIL